MDDGRFYTILHRYVIFVNVISRQDNVVITNSCILIVYFDRCLSVKKTFGKSVLTKLKTKIDSELPFSTA